MDLGDRVVYYTHDSSDEDHRIVDQLAFVLGIPSEDSLDVVVLPPGGPIIFARVSQFDPDNPYLQPGGSYWREVGEDPPDFNQRFEYASTPEWVQLTRRQITERERAPTRKHEELADKHRQQQDEFLNSRRQEAQR